MKYYTEHKVNSHDDIAVLVTNMHKNGVKFAFYFDLVNTVRLFSNEKFEGWNEVTATNTFIKCERVMALERQTPRQQQKRIERLKAHLAKKGIEYKEDKIKCAAKSDYYLNIFSYSSRRNFRLNIKNTVVFKEKVGNFDSYGLSKDGSTIPLF